MRRQVRAVLAVATIGVAASAVNAPAATRTEGKQSFKGIIIATRHHGRRTVSHSVLVAKGLVSGVGRVVEVPNRPGDPDRINRDDLVLGGGRMHLVSINKGFKFSVNPRTCVFRARIKQASKIEGGTGRFQDASGSFNSALRARGVADRDSKGKCTLQKTPLQDADAFYSHGHLSL